MADEGFNTENCLIEGNCIKEYLRCWERRMGDDMGLGNIVVMLMFWEYRDDLWWKEYLNLV